MRGLRCARRAVRSFATTGAVIETPRLAIERSKAAASAKFAETVEVALKLAVDPRKPGQNLRGVVDLPHGTGKKIRIAVFARGDLAAAAEAAGVDAVGAEDLVDEVMDGRVDFDRVIASPDMMGLVGKAARVLGPRGLMPNPKLGTLTTDVVGAIEAAKKGQAVYRADKFGIIHCGFGKVDFETEKLLENLKALMLAVHEQKPKTMKGKFYEHATISSTMGPACKVDTKNLDPTSSLFFREI